MSSTDKPVLKLQCGSCRFLIKDKKFERPCTELGKLASSRACHSHHANAFSLTANSSSLRTLGELASVISCMGTTDLQTFAALLLREKVTRKSGFHFFQKVYIRLAGSVRSNYLNNFVVGHVLDADKETLRIVGLNGRAPVCVSVINCSDSSTFYTVNRFAPLRDAMVAAGAYIDPESTVTAPSGISTLLDAAQSGRLDEAIPQKRARRTSLEKDLVSFVAHMARGHLKEKRKNHPSGDEVITIRH